MSMDIINVGKKCQNCKFWGQKEDWPNYATGKVCFSPHINFVVGKDIGEVNEDYRLIVKEEDREIQANEGGVMDGSSYAGIFLTGPDFCCIHFSSKEKE